MVSEMEPIWNCKLTSEIRKSAFYILTDDGVLHQIENGAARWDEGEYRRDFGLVIAGIEMSVKVEAKGEIEWELEASPSSEVGGWSIRVSRKHDRKANMSAPSIEDPAIIAAENLAQQALDPFVQLTKAVFQVGKGAAG